MSRNNQGATPVRVTRARSKTPGAQAQLPALDPKQSHAYGAAGKTQLHSQIRTQSASFAEDFNTTRKASGRGASTTLLDRDDEDEQHEEPASEKQPSPVRQVRRRQTTVKQQVFPAIEEENSVETSSERSSSPDPPEHSISGRNMTDLDSGAEYAGVTTRLRDEMRRQVREPNSATVFYHTLPRYLREISNDANTSFKMISLILLSILLLLSFGFLSGFIVNFVPLPARIAAARDTIATRMKLAFGFQPYEAPPKVIYDDSFWNFIRENMPDMAEALSRLDKLEKHVATVKTETRVIVESPKETPFDPLRTTNWFAVGQGARIDPYNTSPRAGPKRTWYQSLYCKLSPTCSSPNQPITALQKWDEAGDCWCTEPSVQIPIPQIAIMMPNKIYPDKLVIDHIPPTGTQDIAAAPKDFEIWVDMGSEEQAQHFANLMYETIFRHDDHKCGSKPDDSWICIAQGYYDIHEHDYVQSFSMWPKAKEIGLAVNKVIVRVNSNWGGEHTCIYRLRMTGEKSEE